MEFTYLESLRFELHFTIFYLLVEQITLRVFKDFCVFFQIEFISKRPMTSCEIWNSL